MASLRLFLRSSTGPNRRFQPQSPGRVRDPVRIAKGPTAIDAATQRGHFGFRLRLVDKLQPIGGASQRPRREDGKRRVFALHMAQTRPTPRFRSLHEVCTQGVPLHVVKDLVEVVFCFHRETLVTPLIEMAVPDLVTGVKKVTATKLTVETSIHGQVCENPPELTPSSIDCTKRTLSGRTDLINRRAKYSR